MRLRSLRKLAATVCIGSVAFLTFGDNAPADSGPSWIPVVTPCAISVMSAAINANGTVLVWCAGQKQLYLLQLPGGRP